MTETKDRIFGLDIVRCIAIVFVLISHTAFILPVSDDVKKFAHTYFGVLGVEFFFILSGYLIGGILMKLLEKRPPTFSTIRYFWIRRWFRTLPAYYLTILLSVIFYYLVANEFVFSDTYNLLHLVFLQNFIHNPSPFFMHSWSLSVEEWFYISLPIWMAIFYFFIKRISALQAIILFIIIVTLFRVIVVGVADPDWNLGVRTIVPLRLDTLMVGVLAAYFHLYYPGKWVKYAKPCFIAGLIMLVPLSAWMHLDVIIAPGKAHFLSKTLLFNFLSIAIALCMPYMSQIKTASSKWVGRVVTHISLVSYSLYLIHIIVIHIFLTGLYVSASKLNVPWINTTAVRYAGSWIVCIIAASIMYRYFEKPFTNLRERFRLNPETNPLATHTVTSQNASSVSGNVSQTNEN